MLSLGFYCTKRAFLLHALHGFVDVPCLLAFCVYETNFKFWYWNALDGIIVA